MSGAQLTFRPRSGFLSEGSTERRLQASALQITGAQGGGGAARDGCGAETSVSDVKGNFQSTAKSDGSAPLSINTKIRSSFTAKTQSFFSSAYFKCHKLFFVFSIIDGKMGLDHMGSHFKFKSQISYLKDRK